MLRQSSLCTLLVCMLLILAGSRAAAAHRAEAGDPYTDGFVTAIALLHDGKAILGGSFAMMAGQPYHDICPLTADGSVDRRFADVNACGNLFTGVYALALQAGGKVLVSGTLAPSAIGAKIHDHLLRLNFDGSLDGSFVDASPDGAVLTIALQPDGKLWAGGSFLAIGGQPRRNLARLNAYRGVDATAAITDTDDSVRALALRQDGKLWVAGYFSTIDTQTQHWLAWLDTTGKVDPNFADANVNSDIVALALQTNSNGWVGGDSNAIYGQSRHYPARRDADGALDADVADANVMGSVPLCPMVALATQPNGKIWVGGTFVAIGGQNRHYLALLNVNGSLDTEATDPKIDGWVFTLAAQPDGKLEVGGNFLAIDGNVHPHLVWLDVDASLDSFFVNRFK